MKKRILGYSLFFVVLTIGFLYFVFAGTDHWKTRLPVISYVKPFSFVNQDGVSVTEQNLEGKVTVVEYFFTTCKGICPKMSKSMKNLYNEFKDEPDFLILAHTVEPENDSLPRLRFYADSMNIDTKKWQLLTGRKDSLYNAARVSYILDDPKNNLQKIEDQFIHTQFFALVDKNGQVRGGAYDALKQEEMKKLSADIATLLKEKMGRTGFVNSVFSNNPN